MRDSRAVQKTRISRNAKTPYFASDLGPPENPMSYITCILRRILANREKRDLLKMSDKRESIVKTVLKSSILRKQRYYLHSGTFRFEIWNDFAFKMGVPWGAVFIHFRVFVSVVFSTRFRSAFSVVQGPKRAHFGTPRGSKFVLSCRRRAIFQKIVVFCRNRSQGWAGALLGVPFGGHFLHVLCFLPPSFSSRFWDPSGDLK
jgi:hypothetical protein